MLPAKCDSCLRKITPCPFDNRARIKPSQGQNAFPISLVIGNAFSHGTSIADKVSLDLIPIEPDDPPSAIHQKINFSALSDSRVLHSLIEPSPGLSHAAVLQTFMAEGESV